MAWLANRNAASADIVRRQQSDPGLDAIRGLPGRRQSVGRILGVAGEVVGRVADPRFLLR